MSIILKTVIKWILLTLIFTFALYYFEKRIAPKIVTSTIEIDGKTYFVSKLLLSSNEPTKIRDVGSNLVCSTMEEIFGKKIKKNAGIDKAYNIVTGDELTTDCYEKNTKIAVDYLPDKIFDYNGVSNYNKDIYEFYDRLAINADKKEKLQKLGYNYIEVPYNIDKCFKGKCQDNVDIEIRKKRIKNYLEKEIKRNLV